ncbi:MAG: hypothetical protein Q8P67_24885 [archaeon]|nr:hypothetical protein [archaeon]
MLPCAPSDSNKNTHRRSPHRLSRRKQAEVSKAERSKASPRSSPSNDPLDPPSCGSPSNRARTRPHSLYLDSDDLKVPAITTICFDLADNSPDPSPRRVSTAPFASPRFRSDSVGSSEARHGYLTSLLSPRRSSHSPSAAELYIGSPVPRSSTINFEIELPKGRSFDSVGGHHLRQKLRDSAPSLSSPPHPSSPPQPSSPPASFISYSLDGSVSPRTATSGKKSPSPKKTRHKKTKSPRDLGPKASSTSPREGSGGGSTATSPREGAKKPSPRNDTKKSVSPRVLEPHPDVPPLLLHLSPPLPSSGSSSGSSQSTKDSKKDKRHRSFSDNSPGNSPREDATLSPISSPRYRSLSENGPGADAGGKAPKLGGRLRLGPDKQFDRLREEALYTSFLSQAIQLFSRPPLLGILISSINVQRESTNLLAGLCILFESRHLFGSVLDQLFELELGTNANPATLLREDSPAVLLCSGFLHLYGTAFLPGFFKKALSPLTSKKALSLGSPIGQIWFYRRVCKTIFEFSKDAPLPVLRLLLALAHRLHSSTDTPLADAFSRIICSVYYLRFLSPYLVSTGLRLIAGSKYADFEPLKKGFLLSIKMLQCLSSGTELSFNTENRELLNTAILSSTPGYHEMVGSMLEHSSTLVSTPRFSNALRGTNLANSKLQVELVVNTLLHALSPDLLSHEELPDAYKILCHNHGLTQLSSRRSLEEIVEKSGVVI